MPLPLLALGAAAIPEIYKFAAGAKDRKLARELAKKPRPYLDVPIPGAIKENVRIAKNLAGTTGLPGQGVIENKIGANTASATRNLVETQQGGASAAAGIAALDQNANDAIAGIGVQAGELQLKQLADYMAKNNTLAGFEADKFNREWDWNQKDPYLQNMAAASALRNSGEQNQFSAVNNLSSLVSSTLFGMGGDGNKTAHDKVTSNTDPVNLRNPPPVYQFDTTGANASNEQDMMGYSQDAVNTGNQARLQQLRDKFLPLGFTEQQIQQMFASTQQPH